MNNSTLRIRTPEGVVFTQTLAGPVTRALAWIIDLGCIMGIMTVINILMGFLSLISMSVASMFSVLAFFVVSIGYGIVCEWFWRGQTVGKRLLRLRVVDAEALGLQFSQVVIRNLLRFVDSLPLLYFVGGMVCWFSPRCQRLGDLAANTVVVRIPRLTEPDLDQLLAGRFNSLRQFSHIAARVRQRVTPAEAALALESLVRRDALEPGARVSLFRDLAAHFRTKADFPPETLDGIADEQFLRNIIDVVYRAK